MAAIYLLLPSLPLVLLGPWLGLMPRGYIDIEYLFLGAIGAYLPRGVLFALLLLETAIDFAYAICNTFQFSLWNLTRSLASLGAIPARMQAEIILVGAGAAGLCWTLSGVRSRREDRAWTAASLLLGCAALVLVSGHSPLRRADQAYDAHRPARGPLVSMMRRERYFNSLDEASQHPNGERIGSASALALGAIDERGSEVAPDVVFVLVESWGLAADPGLRRELTAPFEDSEVTDRYEVRYGSVPFDGGTVPAEARELCHSRMGFGILRKPAAQMRGCLPGLFHDRGYSTVSVHGYSGRMFQRESWYRRVGFERSWFEPELDALGMPQCRGAYPGTCGGSIANWIGESVLPAQDGRPKFVYWVTLNSHLPVPAHVDLPDNGACVRYAALRESDSACSWFKLVLHLNDSVAAIAQGKTARPTVFVVVGDHAPPFADAGLRAQFSASEVPYALLLPKRELDGSGR
jgi:hypothetical protein